MRGFPAILIAALLLGGGARASAAPGEVEPLFARVGKNCFAGMTQVSKVRKGDPRSIPIENPKPGYPRQRVEIIDTLSATVTQVLRNACGEGGAPDPKILPGRHLEFLRPKDGMPATAGAEGLRVGDMAIVLAEAGALDAATLKAIESAKKKSVLEILIRHASRDPGTPADLVADLGWYDPDVGPSAIHALGTLGPNALQAKAPLLALLKRPDAPDHLEEIFRALQAIGLEKEEFRKLLEATLDKADLSRTRGLVTLLAELGPASFPRLAKLAETHPDKWIRYEAVFNLCEDGIKGPAAEALARKKSTEDSEPMVKQIAQRILRQCYGGAPK